MPFKKWITGIFWWKKTSELEKLVEKQHEIIKELGERSKEIGIPTKKHEEIIEKFKNEVRENSNILEKEREKASSLERDIKKQQRVNTELKGEVERKTTIISEYEGKLKEVSNRYQEAIEKLEKERDITVTQAKEIENELRRNSELRREFGGHEESIQRLKNEIAEINNRYQYAIEKLDKATDNIACLEMLILELDKELGLMDIVDKIETKTPEITIKT